MNRNCIKTLFSTYYVTKVKSDSVAIRQLTDCRKNAIDEIIGATHRNTRNITVRCTFFLSFKYQSTNIWVRCTYSHKVILFDVRFNNRRDLAAWFYEKIISKQSFQNFQSLNLKL